MNVSEPIKDALKLPRGARFFRCALQINPFAYLQRYSKVNRFPDEQAYNNAVIAKCQSLGIEVIAIADRQRANTADSLAQAAREKGLVVFPGVELETKEGAHFLCLFDPETPAARVNGILDDCGIHDQDNPPTAIKYDVHELLHEARKWPCVLIAAHAASENGLLKALDNQARARIWKEPSLTACALPGPIGEVPQSLVQILENTNADYKRARPVAILNAQDVSGPDDLSKNGTTCWIKMSDVSVEGLRQAFLDPRSRVRLAGDPVPEEHSEFVALTWQGGFLDGAGIHFNDNLNVLIGGRGTGKSTVVESLRYVLGLEPLGKEATVSHEGIVRHVLKSGTKVSLRIAIHKPAKAHYTIERTVPNPPVVRDEEGNRLSLTPSDVIKGVEIYGQHEISELAKSPERRTRLLERFIDYDPSLAKRKADSRRHLERSRARILELVREKVQTEERLNRLPAIEATLVLYQKLGLENRLKEQSLLVKEERVLRAARDRLTPFRDFLDQLQGALPIDTAFLSAKALEELPGKSILAKAETIFGTTSAGLTSTAKQMDETIISAEEKLARVESDWNARKQSVMSDYEAILRELQKSKVDGAEFIELRRQIEELRPQKEKLAALDRELKERETQRRSQGVEWEDVRAAEFRQLEKAARKVNRELDGRVLVDVVSAGDRGPIVRFLDERIGGRLAETKDALKQLADFSLTAFTDACRAGKNALAKAYNIPLAQAEKLASADKAILLELEELDLPPTMTVKLNVAPEGASAQWQTLEELSTGQRATALLLLLLLESQSPLVVDQPEDDLDNRFITDGVVPKMREEKRRRQFVFATHNANIPVLGDAELIVGLSASGDASHGKARWPGRHMGSIDSDSVRQLVGEVLEGGKEAFETRRLKYGF